MPSLMKSTWTKGDLTIWVLTLPAESYSTCSLRPSSHLQNISIVTILKGINFHYHHYIILKKINTRNLLGQNIIFFNKSNNFIQKINEQRYNMCPKLVLRFTFWSLSYLRILKKNKHEGIFPKITSKCSYLNMFNLKNNSISTSSLNATTLFTTFTCFSTKIWPQKCTYFIKLPFHLSW